MKILNFFLQHKGSPDKKEIDFVKQQSIIHSVSNTNSKGKTTLMRAILYTLGFAVPSTELVKFEDFIFNLDIILQDKEYTITRKENLLIINGQEFDLPTDSRAAHSFLFNISNVEILDNLLGAIYFDQEKGWTLLNRGIIIGTTRFNIESFFRGLKEDESSESYQLVERITAINKKIAQYKLMLDVAEYQASLNYDIGHKLDFQAYQETLDTELLEKKVLLENIEIEIRRLDTLMKSNKGFSDYIESKHVYVKHPDPNENPIRVTRDTLLGYDEVEDVNLARRSILVAERAMLKKGIAKIESSQDKQITLSNQPDADIEIASKLASIRGISSIEVSSIMATLKKEKKELTDRLKNRTKLNNEWINKAYRIIDDYAKELNIPFNYKIDIFTSKLKGISGAILHKMIFIYKLAYIKLLSEKIGYPVPIFCDSPSGREVEMGTITTMLNILKRDFSKHQIFIASIHTYDHIFEGAQIITLDGTLFDKANLSQTLSKTSGGVVRTKSLL